MFYLPLYLLFVVFVFDGIATLGRAGMVIASSAMTLALAFAVFHFSQTANVTHTRDWYGDASTKAMIADLEHTVAAEPPSRSPTRLAVYSFFYPVALFYGQRSRIPLEIDVAPGRSPPTSSTCVTAARMRRSRSSGDIHSRAACWAASPSHGELVLRR